MSNSGWLIGNGKKIDFWSDNWNGSIMFDYLNSAGGSNPFLKDKFAAYIQNRQWYIPRDIQVMFPSLYNLLSNVQLSVLEKEDISVWNPTTNDILSLKATYDFKYRTHNPIDWGKKVSVTGCGN